MNIDHLREFAYLAETLSFGITANTFFISQSVLSKHIAALEKELGCRLFIRTRQHVSLTEFGRIFYTDIQTVLNAYDKALDDVNVAIAQSKHIMRLGYLRYAAAPFLNVFVEYVESKYPEIAVEATCLEYGPLIKAHWSHEVDVILSMDFDPAAQPVCDIVPIYSDKLLLVVPEGHPLFDKTEGVEKSDLEGMKFVMPRKNKYPGFGVRVASLIDGVNASEITEYNDIYTMFNLIRSRGYLGFCSRNVSANGEGVRFLPLRYADTTYDISAMWLKTMNAELVEAARDASVFCRKYLERHRF